MYRYDLYSENKRQDDARVKFYERSEKSYYCLSFNRLSKGDKPFTLKFSKSIKQIGLLLMVTDVILPILYSFVVSVQLDGSLYVSLGVGNTFLIGLILLVVTAIFDYGIELQFLSDETV